MKCLRSGWVVFDAVLVASGLLSFLIMPLFYLWWEWHTGEKGSAGELETYMGQLLVLRVVRLLKL